MTFALGIRVRAGLVAFADTKIVRGSEPSRKSKLTVMHHAGRTIFVMTSGLRSIRDKVVTRLEDDLAARTEPYERLHEFASAYGAQVQQARLEDGNALREAGMAFDTHAIIGGQLDGDATPELFHVYPEGNWVLATEDAPYFVVGRSAYGRSILDPLLTYDSDLEAAATVAYLSFEATRSSATDVDYPFDLVVAGDPRRPFQPQRYHATDLDLADRYWREQLRAAVTAFPMRWQPPT